MYDIPNRSDRILWDNLLKELIPQGRTVFGFANSDAHDVRQIDTAFMDFILPVYSLEELRKAMETGSFFAVARYAKNELGDTFEGKGAVPQVMKIAVDDDTDTIAITDKHYNSIEWIADGKIIRCDKIEQDGKMTSVIHLNDYTENISCYVRTQLKGAGGICMTQAFICDDGNMERFKKEVKIKSLTEKEKKKRRFYSKKIGVIYGKITKRI